MKKLAIVFAVIASFVLGYILNDLKHNTTVESYEQYVECSENLMDSIWVWYPDFADTYMCGDTYAYYIEAYDKIKGEN